MQSMETNREPNCPRCGYDLRGVMSLWEETCPLMGKCSECGLDFDWSYTLMPDKYEPRWCVEFSPKWSSVPKSGFRTFRSSLLPWRFWSRLKMSHPIRWKRLAAYVCMLILPYLLSYVVAQGTVAVIVRYRMQQRIDEFVQRVPVQIAELQALSNNVPAEYVEGYPEDQRDAKKKLVAASINNRIAFLKQVQKTQSTISLSYVEAILEALIYPLSDKSSGQAVLGIASAYPPPSQLYNELVNGSYTTIFNTVVNRRRIPGQWSNIRHVAMPVVISMSGGIAGFFLFPVAMILLPASRRKAKVKWSHIVRVSVYSASIPQVLLLLSILLFITAISVTKLEAIATYLLIIVGGVGIWLGLFIWWAFAIKRYLKMPHGFAVSVLLCFMIALLLTAISVIADGLYGNWY